MTVTDNTTQHFEDLEISETHRVGEYTITKAEIINFAERFDPQPFHVDPEAAADSIFGGIIASGLHTLCLATRLTVTEFFDTVANMGGSGMDNLRWHEPVRPGDTLSVSISVLDKRPSESHDDRGYVDFERAVLNQHEETVMTLTTHNIIARRPNE